MIIYKYLKKNIYYRHAVAGSICGVLERRRRPARRFIRLVSA